jgi:hypothetical protein
LGDWGYQKLFRKKYCFLKKGLELWPIDSSWN